MWPNWKYFKKNRLPNIIKIFIFILVVFGSYKVWREIFWVEHLKSFIDENISVELRIDVEILAFLDPISKKQVSLYNKHTNKKLKISFESLDQSLEFYIDTFKGVKSVKIRDEMWGYNAYDYNTLEQLNKYNNFHNFNDSYTSDLEILPPLKAKAILTYNYTGFQRK